GWGLGWPNLTPFYFNDMIAPSLAEEIGLAGLMGIIVIYGLIGFRGLKMALLARDNFTKLFAAGLSFGFLLQVFIIIGGSTRLLPLTGLTSPFLSQGGSSMIANWLLIGLLVIISHQVRRPADAPVDLATERTMTINVRQLRRIADGDVAPLLAVPADLVKETDVTVAVPAPTAASVGSSEPSGSSGSTSAPASDPASASVSPAAEPPDLTDADPTEIVVPDLDGRPFSASVSSPATPSKSINDDLTEVMVPDLNGRSAPAASPSPVVPTLSEDNATMTTEVSASDAGIDTETDTDTDDGTSADAEATTTLSPTSPPVPPEVRS
ncbi:MAG: FtsW/RodA/SpoVE family cell cycle protein, partial [Propionibacteriaceae bacterium]|nr:FtsW/RodA/SpoVE family cell cycle protein [Propionibacteriaceae bacterium]